MSPSVRVETHINRGPALDMLSSLVIGSEAAVLVDTPLTIPQAQDLADWIKKTTDKPLVAVFATHFHPDHYLSAAIILTAFPAARFYANSKTVALIKNEAQKKADFWGPILGKDNVVSQPAIPTPYDYSFFQLPGNDPIYLISPINGDAPDETMFWIPSIKTLIAGDMVYSHQMHVWLADLVHPSLTKGWLASLELIKTLGAETIIPGHALTNDTPFGATKDLEHTKSYVEFFQKEIEAQPADSFTPQQLSKLLDENFPGLVENKYGSPTSKTLIEISSQHFGKGGSRQEHFVNLHAHQQAISCHWALAK